MKELKKHLSISEQIDLLQSRGLIIEDKSAVEDALSNINYYRLSGYLHDFKRDLSGNYVSGLTWGRIKHIYDFDRKLCRILMYALEDIEETFKTRLSYTITSSYPADPLIYLRPNVYRFYDPYIGFLQHFYREKENNKNLPFVKHHVDKYGGMLPTWVAVELFTMGNLQAVYKNLNTKYQKQLAKEYNTGPRQLANWIENLTFTRNHLAHYMRVYNFNFGRTPAACRNHKHDFIRSQMIFDQIYIISCMYSDANDWNNYVISEIKELLTEYESYIEFTGLGFPENWEDILMKKETVRI